MRWYICNDSGSGKTLFASLLALLYAEFNPKNKIYANYHLNIHNIKDDSLICEYLPFSLLPYQKIENGNCLVILDDFYAIENVKYYSTLLATMSRKTNLDILLTIQYYTDIDKKTRHLCEFEVKTNLTNLDIKGKLTDKSLLEIEFYYPKNQFLIKKWNLYHIKNFINNMKRFKNVYIKDFLYDTNEKVEFSSKSTLIDVICENSNDFTDIERNVNILYKSQSEVKFMIEKVCQIKNIENKLKIKK